MSSSRSAANILNSCLKARVTLKLSATKVSGSDVVPYAVPVIASEAHGTFLVIEINGHAIIVVLRWKR
jgi:hypothetical protein